MEESVNEESTQEEIYLTLKRYGVDLAQHLFNLLKLLGYNNFPALVKISDNKFDELEETVRTVFATDQDLVSFHIENPSADVIREAKIALYGPLFWRSPTSFKFLNGDRDSIMAAVEIAKTVIQEKKISKNFGVFVKKMRPASAIQKSVLNVAESESETNIINIKDKITKSVSEWLKKNSTATCFTETDFDVDVLNFAVICHKCKVPIQITKLSDSSARISNFTRHIKVNGESRPFFIQSHLSYLIRRF